MEKKTNRTKPEETEKNSLVLDALLRSKSSSTPSVRNKIRRLLKNADSKRSPSFAETYIKAARKNADPGLFFELAEFGGVFSGVFSDDNDWGEEENVTFFLYAAESEAYGIAAGRAEFFRGSFRFETGCENARFQQ